MLQRVKTSHSMFVSPFLLSQHILNDRILEAAFIINSLECERTSEGGGVSIGCGSLSLKEQHSSSDQVLDPSLKMSAEKSR